MVTRYFEKERCWAQEGLLKHINRERSASVRDASYFAKRLSSALSQKLPLSISSSLAILTLSSSGIQGTAIKCQEFGMNDVMLEIEMPEQEIEKFSSMLNNMTSGAVLIELQGRANGRLGQICARIPAPLIWCMEFKSNSIDRGSAVLREKSSENIPTIFPC